MVRPSQKIGWQISISNVPLKTPLLAVLVTVMWTIYLVYFNPYDGTSWRKSLVHQENSLALHNANRIGLIRSDGMVHRILISR